MKTRPGRERIELQQLRATVADATKALDAHVKVCLRCQQAPRLAMRCEVWWNVAKNLRATRRRLDAFIHAEPTDQLPLPGM